MRFTDGAVVLTRDEVVALLEINDGSGYDILIENRSCDTGTGRAVAVSQQSILVLEPPLSEKQTGAWSIAKPISYCIPAPHLRLWLSKLPEDTPHNEALAVSCQAKMLSVAVVNYEELLLGRSVTLKALSAVPVSAQKFPCYERYIPKWRPSDKAYETLPAWIEPSLFSALAKVQAAVAPDEERSDPVRIQHGEVVLKDGKSFTNTMRFDFPRDEQARCWAYGAMAGCFHTLEKDKQR